MLPFATFNMFCKGVSHTPITFININSHNKVLLFMNVKVIGVGTQLSVNTVLLQVVKGDELHTQDRLIPSGAKIQ